MTGFGACWPEVVKKEQGGKPRNGSLPLSSYFATSSESSHSTFDTSPPQLFIVPLQSVDFLRVHAVGMRVYGNLIEIVRTAPLQRDQLFYCNTNSIVVKALCAGTVHLPWLEHRSGSRSHSFLRSIDWLQN